MALLKLKEVMAKSIYMYVKVSGMTATDVQKILNLKHAWEFILDKDVIQSPSNYHLLCHILKLSIKEFWEKVLSFTRKYFIINAENLLTEDYL